MIVYLQCTVRVHVLYIGNICQENGNKIQHCIIYTLLQLFQHQNLSQYQYQCLQLLTLYSESYMYIIYSIMVFLMDCFYCYRFVLVTVNLLEKLFVWKGTLQPFKFMRRLVSIINYCIISLKQCMISGRGLCNMHVQIIQSSRCQIIESSKLRL